MTPKSLHDVTQVYGTVSKRDPCFMFVIIVAGRAIGECWLQPMNLPYILAAESGRIVVAST